MSSGSARPGAGPARRFAASVTGSATARQGFEEFALAWQAQVGEPWPLAALDVGRSRAFSISLQAVQVHDAWICDFRCESYAIRTTAERGTDDAVLIHLMRRGSWSFAAPDGHGAELTVPAGAFVVRDDVPPALFDTAAGAQADVLILPAAVLRPHLGAAGRPVLGPAGSAETRVLMAHARAVRETAADLTPAGLRAARDALLELALAAVTGRLDDTEPALAPALARAAMRIADARLEDPGLTPAALARELHVAVRTLHRAFGGTGQTAAGYIRRRRLEQARLDLARIGPGRRPDVSELAARYQFADASHFIRAFRARYGQTPAAWARSAVPPDRLSPARP